MIAPTWAAAHRASWPFAEFTPMATIVPVLVLVVMLLIGLELSRADFQLLVRQPRLMLLAVAAQMILLPATAVVFTRLLEPSPTLMLAVLALAVSPGGALSNVYTHLARGDVTLSIALTAVSTLVAATSIPMVLPVVSASTANAAHVIGWNPWALVLRLVATVLAPILIGMAIRARYPKTVLRWRRTLHRMTAAGLAAILLPSIIGFIGTTSIDLREAARVAVSFTALAMTTGLAAATAFTKDRGSRLAIAIEFGTRNVAVAALLVTMNGADPAALAFLGLYFLLDPLVVVLFTGALWSFHHAKAGTLAHARGRSAALVASAARMGSGGPLRRRVCGLTGSRPRPDQNQYRDAGAHPDEVPPLQTGAIPGDKRRARKDYENDQEQ